MISRTERSAVTPYHAKRGKILVCLAKINNNNNIDDDKCRHHVAVVDSTSKEPKTLMINIVMIYYWVRNERLISLWCVSVRVCILYKMNIN